MDMEGTCSESGLKSSIISGIVVVLFLISMALVFAITTVVAEEGGVEVKVNAPEYVEEKATFDVTIDVDSVTDFNAGQFDLCFDRSVVKVDKVEEGNIDGTEIPIAMSRIMERDRIRVMPMLPEDECVSGSGYLAKIIFKVKGDEGDKCVLEIDETESFLGNITADEIPVKEWISAEIEVGAGKEEKEEEPPDITWDPMEEVVSSVEGESMTFEIAVEDQEVDISWQINGSEVQTDEGVTEAEFTKSADAGTWNVSAIATSTKTGLSSMHTWIWSVTATSTEAPEETPTPTPTLASGETPSTTPTLAPGETAKPAAATPTEKKPKPTPEPTAPPGAEGKATPGFEAVFAITALTGIAYILLKTRRRGKEG